MRTWLVIPAVGVASVAGALGLGVRAPIEVVAAGALGAATTAAVRALIGDAPASLAGAVLAPLLVLALLLDPAIAHGVPITRAAFAIAAAAWTFVELSRPSRSPLVAVMPAVVAAILQPAFVALVAFAGARMMTAPWARPRWSVAVPIAGALAILVAILAGVATSGTFGALGRTWWGPHGDVPLSALAHATGEQLGPITAVAGLAGLAVIVRRGHAELAVLACALGAFAATLRAGHLAPPLVGIAGIAAGFAVARLAGLVRLGVGQAFAGATAGVLLLLPPVWTVVEHGPAAPRVSIATARDASSAAR